MAILSLARGSRSENSPLSLRTASTSCVPRHRSINSQAKFIHCSTMPRYSLCNSNSHRSLHIVPLFALQQQLSQVIIHCSTMYRYSLCSRNSHRSPYTVPPCPGTLSATGTVTGHQTLFHHVQILSLQQEQSQAIRHCYIMYRYSLCNRNSHRLSHTVPPCPGTRSATAGVTGHHTPGTRFATAVVTGHHTPGTRSATAVVTGHHTPGTRFATAIFTRHHNYATPCLDSLFQGPPAQGQSSHTVPRYSRRFQVVNHPSTASQSERHK